MTIRVDHRIGAGGKRHPLQGLGHAVAAQLRVRTRDEIAALFEGFTLVEPGLVWIPEWRPDSPADVPEHPEQFWALVGVARRDD